MHAATAAATEELTPDRPARGSGTAAANVDATPRPELTPDASADVERAALAAHRALEAIGAAAAEVRVERALSAFVRGAEPAKSLGR